MRRLEDYKVGDKVKVNYFHGRPGEIIEVVDTSGVIGYPRVLVRVVNDDGISSSDCYFSRPDSIELVQEATNVATNEAKPETQEKKMTVQFEVKGRKTIAKFQEQLALANQEVARLAALSTGAQDPAVLKLQAELADEKKKVVALENLREQERVKISTLKNDLDYQSMNYKAGNARVVELTAEIGRKAEEINKLKNDLNSASRNSTLRAVMADAIIQAVANTGLR